MENHLYQIRFLSSVSSKYMYYMLPNMADYFLFCNSNAGFKTLHLRKKTTAQLFNIIISIFHTK